LEWESGSDNTWVSYYEVLRDGAAIDKVAKGHFYFDHSAGADLAASYEVRTVDGAGNVSSVRAAEGPAPKRALVYDDASVDGITLTGNWERKSDLQPAHAGTITLSKEKGATAELTFEGKGVLIFSKLGPDCGKAVVHIDNNDPKTVDTYSADDIWGVCVFQKQLLPGKHTLRLEVLGEHSELAKDSLVHFDGVRVAIE
jgi:hypothetical protein